VGLAKIMIGIFYIGEPRFADIGRANHEKLWSRLRENWPIQIYDYTWNKAWPRNCPSDLAGVVQVWDFYKALSLMSEKYIIKMRTDVWLSDAAVDVIFKELSMIIDNENDLSYIGMELVNDFGENYNRIPAQGFPKVQDFVICANRTKISSTDAPLWDGQNIKKLKSGNRTFRLLMLTETRAYTVRTHMPLIRHNYQQTDEWQLTYDFVSQYKKADAAVAWWMLKKPILGKG
jgi:hypothetical protein